MRYHGYARRVGTKFQPVVVRREGPHILFDEIYWEGYTFYPSAMVARGEARKEAERMEELCDSCTMIAVEDGMCAEHAEDAYLMAQAEGVLDG